jgi:hypothetical protein
LDATQPSLISGFLVASSSNVILLGYTPHGGSYRVFNLETDTVVQSYDVTFDETAPCLMMSLNVHVTRKWRRESL